MAEVRGARWMDEPQEKRLEGEVGSGSHMGLGTLLGSFNFILEAPGTHTWLVF